MAGFYIKKVIAKSAAKGDASVSFGKGVASIGSVLVGVKGGYPVAFIVFGLKEARFGIEEVTVIFRAPGKVAVIVFFTEFFCQTCHTPVVEGKFEGDGNGLGLYVLGHIAVFVPHVER